MTSIEVTYLDGTVETFDLADGIVVVRTPDLLRIGNVEIERSAVRRTTVKVTPAFRLAPPIDETTQGD